MKLTIHSVNTSEHKGTVKNPQPFIILNETGVKEDAHAGLWHRQVSLLGVESIQKSEAGAGRNIAYGEFAENITTEGVLLYEMRPFDRLKGEHVELEVTQIGKKCHGDNCAIFKEVGNCVMPKEGIFARVIHGGKLAVGDELEYIPKIIKVVIITLSDRASRGEYTDKSGPLLEQLITTHYNALCQAVTVEKIVIPDDQIALEENIHWAEKNRFDLIFTTGGTGIGPHDITVETVQSLLDKEIPGIMEHIRLKYGAEKPNALLSRGVAGTIGKQLIFTLPGSPKAVREYCNEILPLLEHAFLMLGGIDGH